MPRSNRRNRARPARDGATGSRAAPRGDDLEARLLHAGGRLESHPDGDWRVRALPGAASSKVYLCPGCRQQVPAGVPHVVAWPAEQVGAFGGPGDRRHWHSPCWSARDRRR